MTLTRPLAIALAIVALAAPAADARPGGPAGETRPVHWSWSLSTDHGPTPRTAVDTGLAGVCLLMGAAAVSADISLRRCTRNHLLKEIST